MLLLKWDCCEEFEYVNVDVVFASILAVYILSDPTPQQFLITLELRVIERDSAQNRTPSTFGVCDVKPR